MWFEILPSAGIILVMMTIPHFSAYAINKLATGNMYRRNMDTHSRRMGYLRDWTLTKNPYKQIFLEKIPDN